jgi:RNA polymerase sigma-B factor
VAAIIALPRAAAPTDEPSPAASDRRLFGRYADARDSVGRDAIVERFLPLARQLASRYQRPHEPFDDVFQVACFGLVKAVDRFDAARGVAFSATRCRRSWARSRHFRDRTWSVRVPHDLHDRAPRVERVVGELTRELGRAPSVDDVARAIDSAPEEVLGADAGVERVPRDVARYAPVSQRR